MFCYKITNCRDSSVFTSYYIKKIKLKNYPTKQRPRQIRWARVLDFFTVIVLIVELQFGHVVLSGWRPTSKGVTPTTTVLPVQIITFTNHNFQLIVKMWLNVFTKRRKQLNVPWLSSESQTTNVYKNSCKELQDMVF